MATDDVDGAMAQRVGDLSRCLSMNLGESLLEMRAEMDQLLGDA